MNTSIFTKNRWLLAAGVLVVLLILFVVSPFVWLQTQLQPVSDQVQTQTFIIPKGQASIIIGQRLQEAGLIRHPLAFRYLLWKEQLAGKIQAGSFDLSPSMSTLVLATQLTRGTNDDWVTIPEGQRVEEIAELFADFPEFDPVEFIELSKSDEGKLFPDTYLFPKLVTAETVHAQMTTTFDQVVIKNKIAEKAEDQGRTLEEVVILASILEREAQGLEDMKMVAGILYNRLEIDMALQVDATLQYAKGYDAVKKQWKPALSVDKELNSPYNTYKFPGLPPRPIANPGLNALSAAVDPTDSEYFYYISDKEGNMHYSVTYEEHLANIEKYLK